MMRTILLLICSIFAAQTVPEATLRITVTLVQVDAVVTDGRGRRVSDLTKDDFVILQDGKPRKVTHCTYFAEPPSATAPWPLPAPAGAPVIAPPLQPSQTRRVMALVVDDLGMSFASAHYTREALKKYVDEQMRPGDLVSIVRTGSSVGALQQFTPDKQLLHAAIERVRWNGLGRADSDAVKTDDAALDALDPKSRRFVIMNQNLQHEMSSVGTVGALTWVVRGLQEMPGRKSVILLSDGSSHSHDRRAWTGRGKARGLFTKNDNDIPGAVSKSVEDQNGYYMLGYNPGPDTFQLKKGQSKYHRVSVKVTRSGLEVRSRAGFLGVPDEPRIDPSQGPGRNLPVNRERLLLDSIASPFQAEGMRLHLAALFGNASDTGSYVHAIVHMDGRDLTFVKDGAGFQKATVDVVLATFDADSEAKGSVNKDYAIRVPDAEFERAVKSGFLYRAMLPMKKPGAYQFRVGVRDVASGKFGSASQFLNVSDMSNGKLALSGVSLDSRLTTSAGAGDAERAPALRVFRHGGPIYCGVIVSNAASAKGAHRPQVGMLVRVLRDGKVVWRGEPFRRSSPPSRSGRISNWYRRGKSLPV